MTLLEITERIDATERAIALHEDRLKELRIQKTLHYDDGGQLPFAMMSGNDQARINKLPWAERGCSYCGADKVKLTTSSRFCIACGHIDRFKKKEKPNADDTKK